MHICRWDAYTEATCLCGSVHLQVSQSAALYIMSSDLISVNDCTDQTTSELQLKQIFSTEHLIVRLIRKNTLPEEPGAVCSFRGAVIDTY